MLDDPNQPPTKETPSDILRRVADLIERNPSNSFGGAAVVLPPEGAHIEVLILDPSVNLAQFWSALQGRIALTLQELDGQQHRQWTGR